MTTINVEHLDVERTLHRVTLIGDRPVGPDGFSELISGVEFRAKREPATVGSGV